MVGKKRKLDHNVFNKSGKTRKEPREKKLRPRERDKERKRDRKRKMGRTRYQ